MQQKDVVIIGAGPAGIFTALEMLKKGVISATISQQPFQQGSRSLDLLFACLTSGTVPEREQYFVEHSIRIRENYRTPQIR